MHEVPEPPLLRANTRSRSYANGERKGHTESSLEQTVGEMKRLRSTRNEKALSTTFRKARASRVIEGPRPGSAGADGSDSRNHNFQIIEDQDANGETRTELAFGNNDALTLDDIPRIVAAEQAKEQRPNAYRHARNQLMSGGTRQPKLLNGHQRGVSAGNELNMNEPTTMRQSKYFSELSALEYFIVRHVAVLSMSPLVEGHFNLEELLSLIESRKPTFWGKFGKAFKQDGSKGKKKKGVFGIPLETLIEKDSAESTQGVGPGALRIPAIVDESVSAMRQMDMSVEGVFRKNGNLRRLNEMIERIDNKDDTVDLEKENPVQIAVLLKRFLRNLPEPVLTFKLHRLFIVSQSKSLHILLVSHNLNFHQKSRMRKSVAEFFISLAVCYRSRIVIPWKSYFPSLTGPRPFRISTRNLAAKWTLTISLPSSHQIFFMFRTTLPKIVSWLSKLLRHLSSTTTSWLR